MERKNLKEKALFLLCLGALVGNMSTEMHGAEDDKYAHIYTPKNEYKGEDLSNLAKGIKIVNSEEDFTVNFPENQNIRIKTEEDTGIYIWKRKINVSQF